MATKCLSSPRLWNPRFSACLVPHAIQNLKLEICDFSTSCIWFFASWKKL
uniref:Uncharacterized protein n=1 Tax=Rhizophora mucronata TaxID=61149 RepID=A0A2P2IY20_RHIMU